MIVTLVTQRTRRRRARACGGIGGALLVGLLLGCDGRGNPASKVAESTSQPRAPLLKFAADLRAPFPDVSAFLDRFLHTCQAGDYAGYRRLVSRASIPETRERFEAMYHAVETVTVESIESVETSAIPPPVYRVVTSVEFTPQPQSRPRQRQRKVAILVFKEENNWVMAPAPRELQPQDELPPTTTSAPTASAPAYPWDEEGDY